MAFRSVAVYVDGVQALNLDRLPTPSSEPAVWHLEMALQRHARHQGSVSGRYLASIIDSYVSKYGTNAVEAVVQAIKERKFAGDLDILCPILDRIATPSHKALVMDAFERTPAVWRLARRLDAQMAAQIVDKQARALIASPIDRNQAEMIIENRFIKHYPLYYICIAERNPNINMFISLLDRHILPSDPPDLKQNFESVLGEYILAAVNPQEEERRQADVALFSAGTLFMPHPESVKLASEIALKRGIRAGIDGVTGGLKQFSPASLAILRNYIELPQRNDEAESFLKGRPAQIKWIRKTAEK